MVVVVACGEVLGAGSARTVRAVLFVVTCPWGHDAVPAEHTWLAGCVTTLRAWAVCAVTRGRASCAFYRRDNLI